MPPLQPASRLDIDLPGQLGDDNTVAGYRVEARCRAVSKAAEALPLPPTASVLVVIRDGIARSATSAPPLAPGDYVLALARPEDLVLLDRLFGERRRTDDRGLPGELAFDGTTALDAIAHLYDPAANTDGAVTLADFVASRFGGTPAIGDRTRFGAVELIVRDMPTRFGFCCCERGLLNVFTISIPSIRALASNAGTPEMRSPSSSK